jgi:hypothetical protein
MDRSNLRDCPCEIPNETICLLHVTGVIAA